VIGIDTNILVRYIVQDDKTQSRLAAELIEKQCDEYNLGYINLIVLCELVWVLETVYNYEKNLIANVIEQILITSVFEIQNSETVWKAVRDYRTNNADFTDFIIAHANKGAGVKITYTFDKKAGGNSLFRLLL
jgi:predicted nucleic-acid-binding protein